MLGAPSLAARGSAPYDEAMRLAIFSDIHGNAIALEAVWADLKQRGFDAAVCLGDAIQGGPQPAEVVARLREIGCPVVMGNADVWLLTGEETGAENIPEERRRTMEAVREWSLAQLSAEDRAFIAAFTPTVSLDLGSAGTFLGYHGSPASFDDVILPEIAQEQLAAYLAGSTALVNAGGHTHVQFIRRLGAGPAFHCNPGSVGVAYSHHQPEEGFQLDPWAEYALLDVDGGRASLTFNRVPFDVKAVIQILASSGRPGAETAIAQYRGRR